MVEYIYIGPYVKWGGSAKKKRLPPGTFSYPALSSGFQFNSIVHSKTVLMHGAVHATE